MVSISCFRFSWVSIPVILLIGAVVLGSLAIGGSTDNIPVIKDVYLFKVDLSNLNVQTALNLTSSEYDSESVSEVLSELGISEIYSFGLWSYCKGDATNSTNFDVTYCSDPTPLYIFQPYEIIKSVLDDISIQLPQQVQDYFTIAENTIKLIFICAIIGVCLAFITLIFTLISYCSKVISCISLIIGILSAVALILAAAGATGVFLVLQNYFQDATEYGIDATLGNKYFYAFIWTSVGATIVATLFNFFAICCGRTKAKKQSYDPDAVPMMVYQEKSVY